MTTTASASALTKPAQLRVAKRSPAYWRVTIDNPPINVMGPQMVQEFQRVIDALEADEQVRVVVFDSAVEGYFLNHSDFVAKLDDLTSMPNGPTARLPRLIGRNRALEVLLSSEDISADRAEAYGYINRALPDAELDAYVEALATRIAKFDKWAIAQTKRLVNTSLPPDVELGAGWD